MGQKARTKRALAAQTRAANVASYAAGQQALAAQAQAQAAHAQAGIAQQQQYGLAQQQWAREVERRKAEAANAPITCGTCKTVNAPRSSECASCASPLTPNMPIIPPQPLAPGQIAAAAAPFRKSKGASGKTLLIIGGVLGAMVLLGALVGGGKHTNAAATAAHDQAVAACGKVDAAVRAATGDPHVAIGASGATSDAQMAAWGDKARYSKLHDDLAAYTGYAGGSAAGLAAVQADCAAATAAPVPPS